MQFRLNEHLSVRKIENEIFVLNRKDSKLHTFNDSGVMLWEAIQHCNSSEALVDSLLLHYEVDRGIAEKDVQEFLGELFTIQLIESL